MVYWQILFFKFSTNVEIFSWDLKADIFQYGFFVRATVKKWFLQIGRPYADLAKSGTFYSTRFVMDQGMGPNFGQKLHFFGKKCKIVL